MVTSADPARVGVLAHVSPRRAGSRWDVWAFALAAAIAFGYLMEAGHGVTFFFDEWYWMTTRSSGLHAVLSAYNNHMLIAPLALYQLLFRTAGLDHYWVFRLLGTAVHLLTVTAVYAFARRRLGAWALALVLPLLVLGYAWEYVIWAVNIGFIASIGLGVCALLSLEGRGRTADWRTCALLMAALACSEFAILFALAVAVEILWHEQRLRRAYVWALPLITYVVWWLAYHQPSMARQNLTAAPSFALDLAASATGGLFGLSIDWGRVLLIAGGALTLRRLIQGGPPRPPAAAVLIAAAAFWFLVALARAQLGEATAPRYIYTGAILIVLILAEAWRGTRLGPWQLGVVAVAVVISLAGNIRVLVQGDQFLRASSRISRAEFGALELARGFVSPAFIVDAYYMPGIIAGPYFAATRRLGSSPADAPARIAREGSTAATAADRLLVHAGELQFRASPPPPAGTASPAPPILEQTPMGRVRGASGCLYFRPGGPTSVDLLLVPPGIVLASAPGAPAAVRARRFARDFTAPAIASVTTRWTSIRALVDEAPMPWHLRLSISAPLTACTAR